jgi:hypothetical protein
MRSSRGRRGPMVSGETSFARQVKGANLLRESHCSVAEGWRVWDERRHGVTRRGRSIVGRTSMSVRWGSSVGRSMQGREFAVVESPGMVLKSQYGFKVCQEVMLDGRNARIG